VLLPRCHAVIDVLLRIVPVHDVAHAFDRLRLPRNENAVVTLFRASEPDLRRIGNFLLVYFMILVEQVVPRIAAAATWARASADRVV
jgi:hypothetical protein